MNKMTSIDKPLKLVAVGNSTGIILPKEMLARLQLAQGDLVDLSELPDGLQLRRHEPDFAEQMKVARGVMQRRRAALRELAK